MQDIFKNIITEIFNEYFKPSKWKKQGQNFRYISTDGLCKIINFQKSKWNTQDEVTFYINYGIYIEPNDTLENKSFHEYDCQFRNRTTHLNGVYTLNRETDIQSFKKEIIIALNGATDFFKRINTKEEFVKSLLNGEAQKHTGEIIMHYHTCKLLYDLGYYQEIHDYVKSKGGIYFDSLTTLIEQKLADIDV